MATWFDESRLDDEAALATAEGRLRELAEAGARVRREATEAEAGVAAAVTTARDAQRPRAIVAAGPDSRLLRAVLEPWCPVPFVAWPGPALPGWAGGLDLVVVLAPDGSDRATAAAVAEAVRRGCQVVVASPEGSLVARHAEGRWSTIVPTVTRDQLATAVVVLEYLDQVGLGPRADHGDVAQALDDVAIACSPHRDLAVNPGKMLAIALADTNPIVWGGSSLAARAARRVSETIRRASGRSAIAGDAEHLLPLIEAARPRDVFDDPFAEGVSEARPLLLVFDDGADDQVVHEDRDRLQAAAADHGVRVETLTADTGTEVARYASLVLSGRYAAEYLRVGLISD
jgi:Bacterial phospho-glucose isomerase C-terminal SIS domain